jgi:hypothetical protein
MKAWIPPFTQRAFYTGFKKLHGIKVETVFLPNEISTLFGPVSARRSDIPVLQTSNLNKFVVRIQLHKQHEYSAPIAYKISTLHPILFQAICWTAIFDRSRTQVRFIGRINWVELCICSTLFCICADPHHHHNQLAKKNPYVIKQLPAAHLLCNIYVCLNGD